MKIHCKASEKRERDVYMCLYLSCKDVLFKRCAFYTCMFTCMLPFGVTLETNNSCCLTKTETLQMISFLFRFKSTNVTARTHMTATINISFVSRMRHL